MEGQGRKRKGIVTKEAARNIGVHFKQEIKGAWDQSKRNKSNLEKSTIVHTTGSVPTAKYQKDENNVGKLFRYLSDDLMEEPN
ncbi:hypothetical protein GBA52_008321 [Prunus armeniaca]|nr:hypothetical protein GBA52_008321 [Prunus armeniaca]